LKEALRLDLIDSQDYSKAVDVQSIKQSGKPRGRSVSPHEIAALMKSCSGNSSVDVRDAALIAILRGGSHDLGRMFCERPPRCWSRYRDSAEVGRSPFPRDDSERTIAGAKKRNDGPCST
jgi:hypothetical protein